MPHDDTTRAFLAVEIPAEVRGAILKWIGNVESRVKGVRWVSEDQIHLTLRFLGSVTQETLDEVKKRTEMVVATSKPSALTATGIGLFASLRRPRIVWVGLEGDVDPLVKLAQSLEEAFEGLDIHQESQRRPFSPHITIGRIRHPKKAKGLEHLIMAGKDKSFGDVPINEIALVKSELTSDGAVYSNLNIYTLGGRGNRD